MSPISTICVMSGTSGSGKSTLIEKLFSEYKGKFVYSISHTTRKPRKGEINGREYNFVSEKEFEDLIADKKLVEYTKFSENYYGTSIDALNECTSCGSRICILDVDVQGVKQLKENGIKAVFVFIKTPTMKHLKQRLFARGSESEQSLKKRLESAKEAEEYSESPGNPYDRIIVNDTFQEAYEELKTFLKQVYPEILN
ncbi:hypothetical protein ACOME3_000170 [Neoechinorhynchus agilis]